MGERDRDRRRGGRERERGGTERGRGKDRGTEGQGDKGERPLPVL